MIKHTIYRDILTQEDYIEAIKNLTYCYFKDTEIKIQNFFIRWEGKKIIRISTDSEKSV